MCVGGAGELLGEGDAVNAGTLVAMISEDSPMLSCLAMLPVNKPEHGHVVGARSGCLCVTPSGAFAARPEDVAAVRWEGASDGTLAHLVRLDVEEMRPGFTLSAKRYIGDSTCAARVEPKVGA